ncbi:MAG TPA: hypothetical protein VFU23_16345 [Gemmatimonadales bacterium]|nr:hypothetical protein [Gemmatimonadales bacterium]
MAGDGVTDAVRWFEEQSGGAPPALRARALAWLVRQSPAADPGAVLALAARDALSATLASPGDRAVALDLLAADALVTLALKARAAADPAGLGAFAGELAALGAGVR